MVLWTWEGLTIVSTHMACFFVGTGLGIWMTLRAVEKHANRTKVK